MINRRSNRFWIMSVTLMLAIVACIDGQDAVQPAATDQPVVVPTDANQTGPQGPVVSRSDLISATVQIYGMFKQNGELQPGYTGSGTIISPTGLILTNAHVASPASQGEPDYEPDALAVGLVEAEDKPPVFSYFAEVKAVDGYLDLAVIQISKTMDGASVDAGSLNLPYVSVGNSDDLHVGDHVNIFGFPGIGGETITYTDGNVSGFTAEKDLGDRAWIKTDATIAGGNSGGLAANDAGEVIGVPTQASSGGGGKVTDCRVVQDTNNDGQLNEQDTCIPIGGFINALRPVKLALPLIKAAQTGQEYASPFGSASVPSSEGSGDEAFGKITWYTGTGGAECDLVDLVTSFPSGITSMAAAFDYSGMTAGEPWAELWTVDGEELYSGKYAWTGDAKGQTFTCLYVSEGTLPDGSYHVQLFAGSDLNQMTESTVSVGGDGGNQGPSAPSKGGEISVHGVVYDGDSNKLIAGAEVYVLNPGTTFDEWKASNFAEAGVFTYDKTDNNGNYSLPKKLSRNVSYTFVVYAEGYPITYGDDLVWTDKEPNDFKMDLSITK